jgi:hypothetical protein
MSSFKKLQLLSEEEVNRLKQKQLSQYNPQLRAAAFLQTEIDDLLGNTDMDSQQKMTLFQMAQQRFASLVGKNAMSSVPLAGIHKEMTHDEEEQRQNVRPVAQARHHVAAVAVPPPPPPMAVPQVPLQVVPEEEDDVQLDHIIGTVPKSQKKRAEALLIFLEKRKAEMAYDEQGQLVIKGQPVIGSNYQDLILSLYTFRKDFHPIGQDIFSNALRQVNIPRGIIKNTKLLAVKPPQAVDDDPFGLFFGTTEHPPLSKKRSVAPPGKAPKVLSVYGSSKA